MTTKAPLILCATLLLGCNDLEERARQAVISSNQTSDPVSAQLKELKSSEHDSEVICADINLKNESGAYTGFETAWINTNKNYIVTLDNQSLRRSSVEEKIIYAKLCTPNTLELKNFTEDTVFGINKNGKNIHKCDEPNAEFCTGVEIEDSDEMFMLLTNKKIGKAFESVAWCQTANHGIEIKRKALSKEIEDEKYKITLIKLNPNKTPSEKQKLIESSLQNISELEKQESQLTTTKEKSRTINNCEFLARSINLKQESEVISHLNSRLGLPKRIDGDDETYYRVAWHKENKSAELLVSKLNGVSLLLSF